MSKSIVGVGGERRGPSLLITSNFSNKTGMAWKFFFRLFNVIARKAFENRISICLSFAKIDGPVTILDHDIPFEAFEFDPISITVKGLWNLRRKVLRNRIEFAYLTDLTSWHWLYTLLRLWGVRKIVVHNHASVPEPTPSVMERGIKRAVKLLLHKGKWASADSVYVCSEFVRDRFVRKACCPVERIKVINHGIDIDRFVCSAGGQQ